MAMLNNQRVDDCKGHSTVDDPGNSANQAESDLNPGNPRKHLYIYRSAGLIHSEGTLLDDFSIWQCVKTLYPW